MKNLVRHPAVLVLAAVVVALGLAGSLPAQAQTPPDEAIADVRVRAEQGDANAQHGLGLMYATGLGVPQDDAEAMRWFRLVAEQGNATAQYTQWSGTPMRPLAYFHKRFITLHPFAAAHTAEQGENEMFNRITPVPAAGTSSTLPTTSRRAFGRRLGLSAAGLALAGCSASEPSADSAPAEAAVDQGFVPAQDAASQAALTPDAALTLLTDGNARFVAGTPVSRDYSDQIRATAAGQYPFAVVLGCIDSRVPIETVFDQGIGDIFAARIAGNIVNTEVLGSLEFACQLAEAKLVVVLGHTSCGAVKGAISSARLGNLTQLVQKIDPAVEAIEGERDVNNADYVDGVAEENVRMVIAEIRRESSVLATMEQEREVRIVGGMYDVSTGVVRFI